MTKQELEDELREVESDLREAQDEFDRLEVEAAQLERERDSMLDLMHYAEPYLADMVNDAMNAGQPGDADQLRDMYGRL